MSGLFKAWKPVVGAAATVLTVNAASAEQCGHDITKTWNVGDAAISANSKSYTDDGITLTALSGHLVTMARAQDGKLAYSVRGGAWQGTNEFYEGLQAVGQTGNGNPDGSIKIWDGHDAQGPDGILIDPRGRYSFDEIRLRITDTAASTVNSVASPSDVGGVFYLTAHFEDHSPSQTYTVNIKAPRDGYSTVDISFANPVESLNLQPGPGSIGVRQVRLKDEREACEGNGGRGTGGHDGSNGGTDGSSNGGGQSVELEPVDGQSSAVRFAGLLPEFSQG